MLPEENGTAQAAMVAEGGWVSVERAPILLATWRLGDSIVDGATGGETRDEVSVDVGVRPSQ
jgi:hypothetical protein